MEYPEPSAGPTAYNDFVQQNTGLTALGSKNFNLTIFYRLNHIVHILKWSGQLNPAVSLHVTPVVVGTGCL